MQQSTTPRTVRIGAVIALLVVAAVVLTGGVAAGPEEEPNDQRDGAQAITLGEEVTGELTSGDVDWFQFTAERGKSLTVSGETDEVGNTNFELLDSDDNQIGGISGLTDASAQTGSISTYTGTYYLRVERRFTDRGGEYSFTVETTDTDAFEPNEAQANATVLVDEEEVEGEITVGDTEWFNITAEQGETINISAFADSSGATNFQLYASNGTFLTGNDGISGAFTRINTTAPYSGTYSVRVTPRFSDQFGATYNLTVDLPGEPPSEPNETRDDETAGDETAEDDETDSGLPLVPVVVAGIAVVLVLLFVVWRFRDDEDDSL